MSLLSDPVVSRRHAMIESGPKGYRLLDLHSKSGSFVNGRRFDEHDLVIGDQIQLGPFFFIYDGRRLIRVRRLSVGRIIAIGLTRQGDNGPILNRAGFVAEPGQFIGILGPSGAGKTTLLNALSGLRPAESGKVRFDQTDLYKNLGQLRSLFGYVPQDDIVHSDLTVTEALTFAARLRLPAGTPRLGNCQAGRSHDCQSRLVRPGESEDRPTLRRPAKEGQCRSRTTESSASFVSG